MLSRTFHYLEITKKNFFRRQQNVTKRTKSKSQILLLTEICNAKVTSNRTITG